MFDDPAVQIIGELQDAIQRVGDRREVPVGVIGESGDAGTLRNRTQATARVVLGDDVGVFRDLYQGGSALLIGAGGNCAAGCGGPDPGAGAALYTLLDCRPFNVRVSVNETRLRGCPDSLTA